MTIRHALVGLAHHRRKTIVGGILMGPAGSESVQDRLDSIAHEWETDLLLAFLRLVKAIHRHRVQSQILDSEPVFGHLPDVTKRTDVVSGERCVESSL